MKTRLDNKITTLFQVGGQKASYMRETLYKNERE